MASHAVEHDYHLVEPSPWPFLSGLAALVWGLGMVVFFAGLVDRNPAEPNGLMEFFFSRGLDTIQGKDVSNGGWIILVIGCLFAAYVMFGWWRDVAKESAQGDHTPVVDIGLRYGMIMFIMRKLCSLSAGSGCFSNLVCFTKFGPNGTRISWKTPKVIPNGRSKASKPLTRGICR